MEFAKGYEGTVTSQHLRLWTCRSLSIFVRISHDKLAGLYCYVIAWRGIYATSFYLWIVKPVFEAKRITSLRQFAKFHTVYDRDFWQVLLRLASLLQNCFQA